MALGFVFQTSQCSWQMSLSHGDTVRPPGDSHLGIVLVRDVRVAQRPEAPGVPPPCAGLTLSALSCRDEAVRGAGGTCFVGANPEGENLRGGRESVPQKANSANRVDGDSEECRETHGTSGDRQ